MNFGEKLTNLRKQKGLSQEELGYELNVTRQTVSKWELGQTTPEMDKLVELSKIFGVSVDELTNDKEITNNEVKKIEDMPIDDKLQNNSSLKVILLIVAIFVIGGVLIFCLVKDNKDKKNEEKALNQVDKIINQAGEFGNAISGIIKDQIGNLQEDFQENEQIKDQASELINDTKNEIQENLNQVNNETANLINDVQKEINETEQYINEVQDDIKNNKDKFEIDSFNNKFEMYSGTKSGFHVKVLIDQIITNNKKEKDKIITVIYKGQHIIDTEKLMDIKRNFEDFTNYEVSFEYDENGYIYQAEIEKI